MKKMNKFKIEHPRYKGAIFEFYEDAQAAAKILLIENIKIECIQESFFIEISAWYDEDDLGDNEKPGFYHYKTIRLDIEFSE